LILDFLNSRLETRRQEDSLRKLTVNNGLIDFTSNDYLGLARSADLFESIHKKTSSVLMHNGATGSRLLSGNSAYTEEVEKKLANIFKSKATLIFNSGYSANLSVLSSLPQRNDTIIYDELAHACIKDGSRLSLAKHFSFRHNDVNDLESKIRRAEGNIFIAVESIYSMDGDECPLKDVVALAEKYNAVVILDEAHSTGVMGENGNGFALSQTLHDRIAVRIYTFGKAMGVHGACVAGSKVLTDYLVNFARPFIYTTALPPHSIASIDCAFDFLKDNTGLQQILQDKISLFCSAISSLTNRKNSQSAIQTAIFPGNANVKRAASDLQQKGFDVRPILSPTVPAGSERLRICLHTFNSDDEIVALGKALSDLSH
jgi:8-amino-7-oxononanoate synthase